MINDIPVELVTDFNGFWSKTGVMHLRDNKFSNLIKQGAYILAVDILHRSYFIIPIYDGMSKKDIKHKGWNKPAVEIVIDMTNFISITRNNIMKLLS